MLAGVVATHHITDMMVGDIDLFFFCFFCFFFFVFLHRLS